MDRGGADPGDGVVDLGEVRRTAFGLVLGQAAVTGLVAGVCFGIAGRKAAMSALLGGGITMAATLAMALVAFGRLARGGAYRVVAAFFAGEVAKLAVVIALLVIVLRTTTVSAGALLAAYMATVLVYWIGLAGTLSSAGKLTPRERGTARGRDGL